MHLLGPSTARFTILIPIPIGYRVFPSGLNEECPCRVAEHQPLTILAVLSSLPVSRRTLAKIKQNLSWAFGYNLVAVPRQQGLSCPR